MKISKIKLLYFALIGLLVINLILLAFLYQRESPKEPDGRPPDPWKGPKDMIIEQLHFDKEQELQYEKLIELHRASVKILEDSISLTKNDLYRSLENENTTDKDSLISHLASLQKEIELIHYNHFAEIKKTCKPDQIVYYNELISQLSDFFTPKKRRPDPPKDN